MSYVKVKDRIDYDKLSDIVTDYNGIYTRTGDLLDELSRYASKDERESIDEVRANIRDMGLLFLCLNGEIFDMEL